MSSLDIAPHPEGAPARVRDRRRMRRRFRVSFRRAGICTIWRLGFRQFSFHHIARVPRRTVPDTWTRPPVSCHALFPLTFRRQVRHQTQGNPSNPSRLSRGYDEAPRGALRFCRRQGLPGLPWCAGVPVRRACRTGTVPLAVELIEGHGAGGEREPGRDARMPPGSRTGLRDGRAAGRVPAVPGRSGAGRRTPARNHRVGRGSGRRPDARGRRGGAGRCGPGSPGYRRVRLPGASRPVVPSR